MSTTQDPGSEPGEQNPGQAPGENDPGVSTGEPKTVDFAEFKTIKSRLNWREGENRKLEKRLAELETELETVKGGTNPRKKDDLETRIEQADKKIKELSEALSQRELKIRDFSVKQAVRDAARGKIRDDAFDAFWAVEGANFDEVEFDGTKRIGLKSAPYEELPSILAQLSQRHSYFAANPRAPGTGEPVKGDTTSPSTTNIQMPAGFDGWNIQKKTEFFRNLSAEQRAELKKAM